MYAWNKRMFKSRRMDKQRKSKLIQKAQKAGAITRLEEILEPFSWNKRFGKVQQLRSVR